MKKITIGRGRECDVRLDDSTDMVSRRQAVITVKPSGKMEIYDTSSNGTFVNGEKVEKPNGKPVKRGDQVNFAHVVDLDWNKVRDPYKSMKITIAVIIASVVVVAVLFFVFADKFTRKEDAVDTTKTEEAVTPAEPVDSLTLQIPEETPIPKAVAPAKRPAAKSSSAQKEKDEIKDDSKQPESEFVPDPEDPRIKREMLNNK